MDLLLYIVLCGGSAWWCLLRGLLCPGAGAGVTVWYWLHIAVCAAAASGVERRD